MFIPEINTVIVEVPKTGTTTLYKCMQSQYGQVLCKGHKSDTFVADWAERKGYRVDQVIAVYRDPVDRFLSAMNHINRGSVKTPPELVVEKLQKGKKYDVFKPISFFVTQSSTILWPFENIQGLLDSLGYSGPPQHFNKGNQVYSYEDIEPHIPFIQEYYKADY